MLLQTGFVAAIKDYFLVAQRMLLDFMLRMN